MSDERKEGAGRREADAWYEANREKWRLDLLEPQALVRMAWRTALATHAPSPAAATVAHDAIEEAFERTKPAPVERGEHDDRLAERLAAIRAIRDKGMARGDGAAQDYVDDLHAAIDDTGTAGGYDKATFDALTKGEFPVTGIEATPTPQRPKIPWAGTVYDLEDIKRRFDGVYLDDGKGPRVLITDLVAAALDARPSVDYEAAGEELLRQSLNYAANLMTGNMTPMDARAIVDAALRPRGDGEGEK